MGNTYHNVVVKGPAQAQIVATLQDQQHAALVSSTLADLTFIYTPDAVWSAPAASLSRTFHCAALFAAVYDSDFFEYQLYDDGDLVDHYYDHTFSSDPYAEPVFDEEGAYEEPEVSWGPTGGDARRLCIAFGVDARVDMVEAILHPRDEERLQEWKVDAMKHHATLAEAMGWPLSACLSDYRDLKRAGVDADLAQEFAGGTFIETCSEIDA